MFPTDDILELSRLFYIKFLKPGDFIYKDRTSVPERIISSQDCNRSLQVDNPELRRIMDENIERHIRGGR